VSIDTDFQSKLVALVPGATVSENVVSQDTTGVRVWWQRSTANVDLLLSGTPALYDATYDLEVSGVDIDATATVADSLKTSLHGFRGSMGSSYVLGMFVQDQSDEYIPKSIDTIPEDEGYHIFTFRVQILS